MQNFIPLRKLYHLKRIDETGYSLEVFERYEKLRCFIRLRAEGWQEDSIYDVVKVSKSVACSRVTKRGKTSASREKHAPYKKSVKKYYEV